MPRLIALTGAGLALAATASLWSLGGALFSFHMTQHLLLIALAAPLLVLGGIELRVPPLAGWTAFVGIFLGWHWPAAFQWAARYPVPQFLELATILVSAWAFWTAALGNGPFNGGARALLVMTAAVLTDLPGVVMLFSPRAICTMPHENAAAWGLTPLEDQQIAGLLMWVPANLVFFGVATFLFACWLRSSDHPVVTS